MQWQEQHEFVQLHAQYLTVLAAVESAHEEESVCGRQAAKTQPANPHSTGKREQQLERQEAERTMQEESSIARELGGARVEGEVRA